MSEQQNYGFGKFVPGFDFLQNLSKGSSQNQTAMPNLSNWVAPTLNVEELDKRIGELRAVHFWLEQNSRALGATIQALELQKMTLATLKGMNFNMAEVADAFRLQTEPVAASGAGAAAAGKSAKPASMADAAADAVAQSRAGKKATPAGQAAAGVADPLQWWGALTQQFQTIAAQALEEAARSPAIEAARDMAQAAGTRAATGAGAVASPAPGAPARRAGAAKKASRKRAAR